MTTMDDRRSDYVELMLNAARQAQSYIDGMTQEDFLADPKTQDAVTMKLLAIGELAAQLLEQHSDFVASHPNIPWLQMKGMRNRMAHGYLERDLGIIWATLQTAIPDLETRLRSIVR